MKKNRGITLIALIITIIILIILAGISINLVLGENGILTRAKSGKENYQMEAAKEKLTLMIGDYITDQNETYPSLLDYLKKQEELGKIDMVEENEDGSYTVIIDGYAITIEKENGTVTEVIKDSGFRKLAKGKAKFVYNNANLEYVGKANVIIEIDESIKAYSVEYNLNNKDESKWLKYEEGSNIEVINNGNIYGRIINEETKEVGHEFSLKISNIDEIKPQEAEVVFDKNKVDVGGTINASITHRDLESGIDIEKCKYIIDTTNAKYGTTSEKWESATAFTTNPQIIPITESSANTYYVHVLSSDMGGKLEEKLSEGIRFIDWVDLWNSNGEKSFCTYNSKFSSNWKINHSWKPTATYTETYPQARYFERCWINSLFKFNATNYSTLEWSYYLKEVALNDPGMFIIWGCVPTNSSQTFLAQERFLPRRNK